MAEIGVYLEKGKKRTFAGAIDWLGWCRSGTGEASALQALIDYGPRYARVLRLEGIAFQAPADHSAFTVLARLDGNATTDFGAPGIIPSSDASPVDDAGLQRMQAILKACWRALEAAMLAARGKELRKGPRGGGRDLDKIVEHVVNAGAAYLSQLGWKHQSGEAEGLSLEPGLIRQVSLEALASAVHGELPERGPRGGVHWPPRYFVRRSAWHVLDHAWEIEDRII